MEICHYLLFISLSYYSLQIYRGIIIKSWNLIILNIFFLSNSSKFWLAEEGENEKIESSSFLTQNLKFHQPDNFFFPPIDLTWCWGCGEDGMTEKITISITFQSLTINSVDRFWLKYITAPRREWFRLKPFKNHVCPKLPSYSIWRLLWKKNYMRIIRIYTEYCPKSFFLNQRSSNLWGALQN